MNACVQSTFHTYCDDPYYFSNEKAHILVFAQDLRKQNNPHAQKLIQWLNQQCIDSSNKSNDCITIADIIINDQLTIQSKIEILSEIMAQQKAQSDAIQFNNRIGAICFGAFFCLMCATIAYDVLFLEPHRPPRPIINVFPRTQYRKSRSHYPYHYQPACQLFYNPCDYSFSE